MFARTERIKLSAAGVTYCGSPSRQRRLSARSMTSAAGLPCCHLVGVVWPNPAVDPVPFGHFTLRDEAAQRRSPLRYAS